MGLLNRNQVGISVGPGHISIVSAARRGEGVQIKRFAVEALEERVCRPSPVEKNIIDPARWKEHARAILEKFSYPSEVRLSLPDSAVRTLLLDLQQLPGNRKEFEKLIQWHMEKVFLSPLGASRFSYQLLSRRGAGWKVLATAVKEEIIAQYEMLDGSRPIEIHAAAPSSLYTFNLFRPLIGRSVNEKAHFLFVHLLDQNLTLSIFKDGLLNFVRVKEFTGPVREGQDEEGSPERSPRWLEVLFEEIGTSLSFYDVEENGLSTLTHVFLSIDRPFPGLEARIEETFHLNPVPLDPSRLIRFNAGEEAAPDPLKQTIVAAAAAAIGG